MVNYTYITLGGRRYDSEGNMILNNKIEFALDEDQEGLNTIVDNVEHFIRSLGFEFSGRLVLVKDEDVDSDNDNVVPFCP